MKEITEKYTTIKYLIYALLICVGVIYIFLFKNKLVLDAVLDESDDFFYYYYHMIIALNVSALLGIIMYWIYGYYNKINILKAYKKLSFVSLSVGLVLVYFCIYLLLGAIGSMCTNKTYVFFFCYYLISLITSAVVVGCSFCIWLMSVKELKDISDGIADVYTSEDDYPKKSKTLSTFCIINVLLLIILFIDNLQLFSAFFIWFVPVALIIMFINRHIMREKNIVVTVSYLFLLLAAYNFWYANLDWYVSWYKQLFIIALFIVIGAYIMYNLIQKSNNIQCEITNHKKKITMLVIVFLVVVILFKYTDKIGTDIDSEKSRTIEKMYVDVGNEVDIPIKGKILEYRENISDENGERTLYACIVFNAKDYLQFREDISDDRGRLYGYMGLKYETYDNERLSYCDTYISKITGNCFTVTIEAKYRKCDTND